VIALQSPEVPSGSIGRLVRRMVSIQPGENIGGAVGRLPDEAMRKRMVDLVDTLPSVE
jgi:hypothetical protein